MKWSGVQTKWQLIVFLSNQHIYQRRPLSLGPFTFWHSFLALLVRPTFANSPGGFQFENLKRVIWLIPGPGNRSGRPCLRACGDQSTSLPCVSPAPTTHRAQFSLSLHSFLSCSVLDITWKKTWHAGQSLSGQSAGPFAQLVQPFAQPLGLP